MLLSIFSKFYELIIGENGDFPEYEEGIFDSVGLITFLMALVICILFYIVLGRIKGIWHTKIHWAITIVICALLAFGFAYAQAKSQLKTVDGYLFRFALINAIYASIYFILLSFFLKIFSIYAKRTPI